MSLPSLMALRHQYVQRIRQAFNESDASLREIARQAGLSPSRVDQLLYGDTTNVRWQTLEAVAGALGVRDE